MRKKYRSVVSFSSLREMLDMANREAADKVAYMYKENKEVKSVTYGEFYDDVNSLGTAMTDLGISKAHVACIAENSYRWINVYLSTLCSDNVFVGIDKQLPPSDMADTIRRSDTNVIFYYKKAEAFLKENAHELTNVKYYIGFDREEDEGSFLSFAKLIEKGRELYHGGNTAYTDITTDVNQMKMLVYTSGTTGQSKGVMLSEKNLICLIYNGLRVSHISGVGLSVLPYHHTYEAVCGILVAIHYHTTVCINESLLALAKNFKLYKPNYFYTVPAMSAALHKNIMRNAQKEGKDKTLMTMIKISNILRKLGIDIRRKLFKSVLDGLGGNLDKMVCGGAPISAEMSYFFDGIGITLLNGYGITECSPLVSVNCERDNNYLTVGYPLPCTEIKIDNPDGDGIGEITVKGDTVMLGYYKDPKATAEAIKDGWFFTGDYGRINKIGQLLITGRKKNLIVLPNGKNIFPEEIEGYIETIPYVKEVVVYESEISGRNVLCAEIFPDKDAMGTSDIKEDVRNALKPLPQYKQVQQVILRETEFEKNTSQKIKRDSINK